VKTVYLTRDFIYRPHWKWQVRFKGGMTYRRVLESAAQAIERAGAGRVVVQELDGAASSDVADAYHAWQRRW
jgi:hypothetical protein